MAGKKKTAEDNKPKVSSAKSSKRKDSVAPSRKNPKTYQMKRIAGMTDIFRKYPNVGAPPLLSEALIDEFFVLFQKCAFIETVCQSLGVDRNTYKNWIRKGRAEAERINRGEKPDPTQWLYLKFIMCWKQAVARSKMNRINGIERHGRVQWPALAWLLERMHPEEFGNQNHIIKEMQKQLNEVQKLLEKHEKEQQESRLKAA